MGPTWVGRVRVYPSIRGNAGQTGKCFQPASQSNAALICVGDYWVHHPPLFFWRASHLSFLLLQSMDFVRCLMGQASLKQLWFGLQHFSRYVNSAKDDPSYSSERRLISIAPLPRLRTPNLTFDLIPVFAPRLLVRLLKKKASHFLGSRSWAQNNEKRPSEALCWRAESSVYHWISPSKWCVQQLGQEFRPAFMSRLCKSVHAGARGHSLPVCECENVYSMRGSYATLIL